VTAGPPRPPAVGAQFTSHHLPDERQLFLFSAVTWNAHRIHYDRAWARHEGHPDLLVHGTLQGGWLAQLAASIAEPWGRVSRFEFRNLAPAYVNQELVATATVTEVEGERVHVSLELRGPQGPVTTGSATLTPDPLTSNPLTPDPLTSNPLTSDALTSGRQTSTPLTPARDGDEGSDA
jgi:acyl dehydratase